jgi:hypothetical protein
MRLGLFVPLVGDPAGLRDYLAADGVRAEIEKLAATLMPVAASLASKDAAR